MHLARKETVVIETLTFCLSLFNLLFFYDNISGGVMEKDSATTWIVAET